VGLVKSGNSVRLKSYVKFLQVRGIHKIK